MNKILTALAVTVLLTACGEPESEGDDLLAPQREAMERAEAVEQVLDEAAERQRREIEEQGG
ncbi:MAG TPA: hypothetical protein VKO38_01535 [Wenzhouxiangella sp.]|nr:hypothetical protein [Wenzhouxiangella sp.]